MKTDATRPPVIERHAPVRAGLGLLFLTVVLTATPALASSAADTDPDASLTSEERFELVELLQRSHAETLQLIKGIGPEQWSKRPAEGKWSIGEVIEHLVKAESAVRSSVTALLEGEADPAWRQRERLGLEKLVVLGSDRSRRFEAPEPIQPEGELGRDELVRALIEARAESIRYVLETQEPLKAYARQAPIGVSLDGQGWLALLGAHNLRHNFQIAEVRDAIGH